MKEIRYGKFEKYIPPEPSEKTDNSTKGIVEPEPLPIFSKIPELQVLVKIGGYRDWTWQYPGALNGQPTEQIRRHLYNPLLKSDCPHCNTPAPAYIDIGRLTNGPHCPECNGHQHKPEIISYSYLQYELERKIPDAIISDFDGYIANDPKLEDQSLWEPGRIFHLGAPMGSGKTTLIYQRAREASESGTLTIIVVPRISLAKAIHAELRKDTSLAWGLFHEGHRGEIGNYGIITSIGWLPKLLKEIIKDERPIRIFIDEIDFASSLILADIFKNLSQEIKDALRESKDKIGIVAAGQTATTLSLEAIAKELDCDLTGYYLSPSHAETRASLFILNTTTVEQTKNRLIQAVIDHAQNIVDEGKHCYIFGDERRSAQIITERFGNKALIYDKYHRDDLEIAELHRLKRLSKGKMILITTTAVDVGVSLEDENAETLVFSVQNPLIKNGLSSAVQQCMRNRAQPPLTIYTIKYQNALPIPLSQAMSFQTEHAKQKIVDGETLPIGLINQMGIKDAMHSLEADQPETFIKHHLKQAGYQVIEASKSWESVSFEIVKEARKRIKDIENEQVRHGTQDVLCPDRLLTESEIRHGSWEEQQPAPITKLAHENANALLRATGWNGKVERFVDESNQIVAEPAQAFKDAGVNDEMWEAAKSANAVSLSSEKTQHWTKGYLTVHYPSIAYEEFQADTAYELHHRSDALFIGALIKALLQELPREPKTWEVVAQALIDAAQTIYGTNKLSALMKDGSVSPAIAKQVRFIDLGRDAPHTQAHFDFVKQFISKFYPARIQKGGDLFQLAQPKDPEQYEAFKQLMQCYVKAKDPDSDPEPENGNLTPPPPVDSKADDKDLVLSMRNQGYSYRQIEQATGVPIGTAHLWDNVTSRSANFPGGPYLGNLLNTPALPESPQTRTGTASETDSRKLAPARMKLAGARISPARKLAPASLEYQILSALATGEKSAKKVKEIVDGHPVSIDRKLRVLKDAGKIVKQRRGVYALPETSQGIADSG